MTVLPHEEPQVQPCRDHQVICRLALRMHMVRCAFFPAKVGSTLSTLRSSDSPMALRWPILLHSRRCDRRSIPDQTDLPPTSRSIPPEILARWPNPAPIPAPRS